jgi:FkbM family methyltransferase
MHYITILKIITPPLIFNFIKLIYEKKPKYFGLNLLDKKLEEYLNYDSGYFVELGANDGKSQSNTLYFERYRNWKGVLVEPTPNKFLECISNRSEDSKIYCNACVSFEYTEKFVEIIYSNLMTTTYGLKSDIIDPESHAKAGVQYLNNNEVNFKFGSRAITLNKLLLNSNAPNLIDLLSLDVEGAELEVLKGINHDQFKFKYICIETRSFDTINEYLLNLNYKLEEKLTHHDYLFSYKN